MSSALLKTCKTLPFTNASVILHATPQAMCYHWFSGVTQHTDFVLKLVNNGFYPVIM